MILKPFTINHAEALRREAIEQGMMAVQCRKAGLIRSAEVYEASAVWMRAEADRLQGLRLGA